MIKIVTIMRRSRQYFSAITPLSRMSLDYYLLDSHDSHLPLWRIEHIEIQKCLQEFTKFSHVAV